MVVPQQIFARISDVHDELARLIKHLDEFPEPSTIARTEGTAVSVTRPFRQGLGNVAATAATAARSVMQQLADMDSTVRAALDDLVAEDAAVAQTAARLESFLDSSDEYTGAASDGGGTLVASASTGGGSAAESTTGVDTTGTESTGGNAWGSGEEDA